MNIPTVGIVDTNCNPASSPTRPWQRRLAPGCAALLPALPDGGHPEPKEKRRQLEALYRLQGAPGPQPTPLPRERRPGWSVDHSP